MCTAAALGVGVFLSSSSCQPSSPSLSITPSFSSLQIISRPPPDPLPPTHVREGGRGGGRKRWREGGREGGRERERRGNILKEKSLFFFPFYFHFPHPCYLLGVVCEASASEEAVRAHLPSERVCMCVCVCVCVCVCI